MSTKPIFSWLYLANATVLILHQIDAAYWHEWELFKIPGGNQVNLILNLPIVILILYGHQALAQGRIAGLRLYWLLASAGLFTVSIHSYFLIQGSEAFRQPVSVGILAAALLLSLAQAIAGFTAGRRRVLPDK